MTSDMEAVDAAITSRTDKLNALAKYLWDNPEINFKEVKAHDYITQFLEDEGFSVKRNFILSTAFRAEFGGKWKPRFSFAATNIRCAWKYACHVTWSGQYLRLTYLHSPFYYRKPYYSGGCF